MGLFTLEHSQLAYRADFVLYGSAVPLLAAFLLLAGPRAQWAQMAACVLAGLAGWSLIEYLLHRFVLHRVQPFQRWHAEHHQRPTALICAPASPLSKPSTRNAAPASRSAARAGSWT
jgi:membrane protein YqaA with SNARE-associated domain